MVIFGFDRGGNEEKREDEVEIEGVREAGEEEDLDAGGGEEGEVFGREAVVGSRFVGKRRARLAGGWPMLGEGRWRRGEEEGEDEDEGEEGAEEAEFEEGFDVLVLDDFEGGEIGDLAHGDAGGTDAGAEDDGGGGFLPGLQAGAREVEADGSGFIYITIK